MEEEEEEVQELGETETGVPSLMLTTAREHVASKPIPRTSSLEIFDSRRTSLHALEMQSQTVRERGGKTR